MHNVHSFSVLLILVLINVLLIVAAQVLHFLSRSPLPTTELKM